MLAGRGREVFRVGAGFGVLDLGFEFLVLHGDDFDAAVFGATGFVGVGGGGGGHADADGDEGGGRDLVGFG